VTLWRYAEAVPASAPTPQTTATAIKIVHQSLTDFDGPLPAFTQELDDAEELPRPRRSPTLAPADRPFLLGVVHELRVALPSPEAQWRPSHGSPHGAKLAPDGDWPPAARLRNRLPRAPRMGPRRARRRDTRRLPGRRSRPDPDQVPDAQRVRRRQMLGRARTITTAPGGRAGSPQTPPRSKTGPNASTGHTCRNQPRGGRHRRSRSKSDERLEPALLLIRG
jgi:hypothetical protein